MIRLFVALALPEAVRTRLAMLAGGVPGAKWQREDQMHLTLRFIGEVDERTAHDIDEALATVRAPAFTLELAGIGDFGGREPHALWAGVRANDALIHLEKKVESVLVRVGLDAETRKYTPHVTLARLRNAPRNKVAEFIAHHSLFTSGPIPIGEFALYSSQLGSGGAVYRVERTYALTQAAEPSF
jgi:RNA 2',3'-cyclic 3'-phosphodiesterase